MPTNQTEKPRLLLAWNDGTLKNVELCAQLPFFSNPLTFMYSHESVSHQSMYSSHSSAKAGAAEWAGGPWSIQLSGQVGVFFLPLNRDIKHQGYIKCSVDRHSYHTRTRDRVLASFPGTWAIEQSSNGG